MRDSDFEAFVAFLVWWIAYVTVLLILWIPYYFIYGEAWGALRTSAVVSMNCMLASWLWVRGDILHGTEQD